MVEDDENLNRGITFSLKKSGYEVFSAESMKKAKRIASDNNVDVTICDVNLPDGNGLEFVRWMRCNYNTYIICLTALDQEMDQVMGYEAGADDYITKPFSLSVLLLKIEAHFRRRQEKTEAGKMISGDIVFIAGEMKVLIKSREISLTKTELKMLTFFLQNPKQILSKTQILENVFDLEGDFVDENTIAVNSGILYDRDEYTIEASYVAFGSQEFYDEHVAENDRQYNIYFTLNDSANVSMNNIDSVIKQIAAACGIEEKNVIVNDLYLQWVLQPSYETIAVCGVLILAIVLFSVVVIYNIFQVGIANKIQEYGKIKALGATKKQMKQLIFREGIFLTIFSIPVGLLLGFLIAKCGFNWLVEQGNLVSTGTDSMGVQNQQVSLFSLPVMLLCIFVSFLTVALALRKPMKIVSRISPIEATRYLENAETHKKGKRNGRKNVTVFSMAMANVMGNQKRTIGTILTLGLSCALFVIISNYVGNIDTEHEARLSVNHGQFELQLDYSAEYDERYPENNLDTILTDDPLNDSLIEEIKSIPGVTDVMTREIVSVNLNGTRFPAAVVSKKDFDFMRQDGDIGSMDYDQAVKNGEIFFGWSMWMEQDGYAPGESIAFDFENGSGTYTYQGKIAGSFVSADTYLVIPEGVYRSMNPRGTAYGYLWVDCDKKDVASVEQNLNTLISNTSHIKMDTYHAQLQSAEFSARTMKLGCYLFMAVVGFIGFMNMANTMIMNITTKKQEYGVLQAVGMTNKQLNLCLQLQGLIFTVGTICVALVVGLPLGYVLFAYAKHNGIFGMNVYHVPITPILAMILLVSLLQIVLSCVLSSNLKKETLVERIRYQG
ncbi:FtsX-like permease family protein [Clostridium perfringens]